MRELSANAIGIFDLPGHVMAWCEDGMDQSGYREYELQPAIDPRYPRSNDRICVFRGGCFANSAAQCRSATRDCNFPKYRTGMQGFRAALSIDAVRQTLKSNTSTAWYGRPGNFPKLANTPFVAAQAKRHQAEWAEYLNLPVIADAVNQSL